MQRQNSVICRVLRRALLQARFRRPIGMKRSVIAIDGVVVANKAQTRPIACRARLLIGGGAIDWSVHLLISSGAARSSSPS